MYQHNIAVSQNQEKSFQLKKSTASCKAVMEDDTFSAVGADASKTYPMQCSALRKGGFVMLNSKACKIVEMSTSKPGKHGHAKVNLVGLDIFTGKKYTGMHPSSHNMNVPNVLRKEQQVINIDKDGFLSLMDDYGALNSSLKVTDDCAPSTIEEAKKMLAEAEDKDQQLLATTFEAIGQQVVKELRMKPY